MSVEKNVIDHYARENLGAETIAAARQSAKNAAQLNIDDMPMYDEFHIGGRPATEYFARKLDIKPQSAILDVGAGIGGPARYIAQTYGAAITGIDLSPDFIDAAKEISAALDFGGKAEFHCGSALDMPFAAQSFDGAYMMHVGMNIEDKTALYQEIYRVLKPGTVFGVYDIMADINAAELKFPVPWSRLPETSFLEVPEEIENHLVSAGFTITESESRRDFALNALEKMIASPHVAMRATTPDRLTNLLENVKAQRCAPHIFICRK